MTKKLINIKNFLRIIISILVIFSMLKSCAKAVTLTEIDNYINSTADYYPLNQKYQLFKSKMQLSNVRDLIDDYCDLYDYFVFDGGSYYWNIYLFNTDNAEFQGNGATLTNRGNGNWVNLQGRVSNSTFSYNNSTSWTDHKAFNWDFYRFSNGLENELSACCYGDFTLTGTIPTTYVGMQAVPQHEYLEFVNTFENIAYNNNLLTYYFQGDFYSYNQIEIGHIIPNDSYYFEIRLKDSNTGIVKGTNFCNVNDGSIYNDGALELDKYLNLSVNTRYLTYSKQYQLEITSYYGDGGLDLMEDIDWFIFLPQNATISGDYILNLGSGDFTTQDSTNQIIENQNNNNNEIIQSINDIVGNLPVRLSGDSSGDVSGDLSSGFDGGGGIIGGIFSLFVPDGTFFKEYFEDLNSWFSDRLGLLYFPIELTIEFLQRILTIDFTSQVLVIGPYTMPLNSDYELVPQIQVDFNSFLEDETVNSIHEIYLFITDGLIIFGLYRLIIKKYNNIVRNKGGG